MHLAPRLSQRSSRARFLVATRIRLRLLFSSTVLPHGYNRAPLVLAASSLGSRADQTFHRIFVNSMNGNLFTSVNSFGNLFGIVYDEAEQSYSWTIPGNCQLTGVLGDANFPRTTPRFEVIIPANSTGWMKFWATANVGNYRSDIHSQPDCSAESERVQRSAQSAQADVGTTCYLGSCHYSRRPAKSGRWVESRSGADLRVGTALAFWEPAAPNTMSLRIPTILDTDSKLRENPRAHKYRRVSRKYDHWNTITVDHLKGETRQCEPHANSLTLSWRCARS